MKHIFRSVERLVRHGHRVTRMAGWGMPLAGLFVVQSGTTVVPSVHIEHRIRHAMTSAAWQFNDCVRMPDTVRSDTAQEDTVHFVDVSFRATPWEVRDERPPVVIIDNAKVCLLGTQNCVVTTPSNDGVLMKHVPLGTSVTFVTSHDGYVTDTLSVRIMARVWTRYTIGLKKR